MRCFKDTISDSFKIDSCDKYEIKMIEVYKDGYGHDENNINFQGWISRMLNYVDIHQKNSIPFIKSILETENKTLKEKYILEFGCNTAATAVALALEGSRVLGVDPDPVAIKIGNIRIEKYGLKDKICLMHHDDCSKLEYPEETFDIVTCVSVLEYIEDLDRGKYIAEMWRVLKKGGILFILETSNGIYPLELHSQKLFINYFPKIIINIFNKKFSTVGITYWKIREYLNKSKYIRNVERYDQVEKFLSNQGNNLFSGLITLIARSAGALNSTSNNMPPEVFLPWLNLAFKKE